MRKKFQNTDKPNTPIILFGYISEPPSGGGGGGQGGYQPGYPTYPGTGGSGSNEGIDDGMGGTLPHGILSSDGQEQVTASVFLPPITNFIRFRYESVAPSPPFTVQTKSLGNWKSGSATANPITYTIVDVGLYASNVYVTLTFQKWLATDLSGNITQGR